MNSVEKLKLLKLDKYYLPCKAKIYLLNINEKRAITILRHFLKVFNYKLYSTEKYINKKKNNNLSYNRKKMYRLFSNNFRR